MFGAFRTVVYLTLAYLGNEAKFLENKERNLYISSYYCSTIYFLINILILILNPKKFKLLDTFNRKIKI